MRDPGALTELLQTHLKKVEVPENYTSLRKRLMENKPARRMAPPTSPSCRSWCGTGAEYLNRRREDVSDFIPADVVENRTDFGIFERAPQRGINYAAYPATCSAMRAQRNLGFHLSASFLCRKPQFNEPLAYSP